MYIIINDVKIYYLQVIQIQIIDNFKVKKLSILIGYYYHMGSVLR